MHALSNTAYQFTLHNVTIYTCADVFFCSMAPSEPRTLGKLADVGALISDADFALESDPQREPAMLKKLGKKRKPLTSPTICTRANIPKQYFTTKTKGLKAIGAMPTSVDSEP